MSNLRADSGDAIDDDIVGIPQRTATADLVDKAIEDRLPLSGMRDFRMKLQSVKIAGLVGYSRDRRIVGRCDALEPFRKLRDVIAVAHPNVE